ncbi:hypothetical protein ACS0TY_035926 [Phlomoides rotata]
MEVVSIKVIHAGESTAAPPCPAQRPPHSAISTPAPRFAIAPVPRQIASINERCRRPRCQSMTRHEELPVPVFKPLEPTAAQRDLHTEGSEVASDKKPKWSARSIKSFAMGELEARKLKFPNTGTEALLMGILVEDGFLANAYNVRFVKKQKLLVLFTKLTSPDMYFFSPEHPPLTEPAQKTFDWAVDEKLKSVGCSRIKLDEIRTGAMAGQKVAANIGGFIVKKPFQQTNAVSKQKSQTLDSLFANMKEQRMRVFSQQHNNNVPKRNGGGQHRVPWARNHLRN